MTLPLEDVQSRVPTLSLSLSRVGVTNVEKVIRLHDQHGDQLFWARFECVVELGPDQKGAHMFIAMSLKTFRYPLVRNCSNRARATSSIARV